MPRTAGAAMTASATRAFIPFMAVSCLFPDAIRTESRARCAGGKWGEPAPVTRSRLVDLKSQHARCIRILDLEPSLAPAGSISGIRTLGNYAFATEFAGVRENGCAITGQVLAVEDPGRRVGDDVLKPLVSLLE